MSITRREWTATALAAAWQHAHDAVSSQNVSSQNPKLEFLSPIDAADIEALLSQIIPSGATPGAREAGALYFIDRALATWDRAQRPLYQTGLTDLRNRCRTAHPESTSLAALSPENLIALMKTIDTTPFFEILRAHTILGFCGPPSYGGNRNNIGWTHLSIEDKMIFQPPFGYYDAEELKASPTTKGHP